MSIVLLMQVLCLCALPSVAQHADGRQFLQQAPTERTVIMAQPLGMEYTCLLFLLHRPHHIRHPCSCSCSMACQRWEQYCGHMTHTCMVEAHEHILPGMMILARST